MTNIPKINNGNAVLDSVVLSDYNNGVSTVQSAKAPIKTITAEILEESFDEIQDSIATSATAAVDGDFIKISDEYEKYWTDGKLKFVEHEETGTYQIQQLDENGIWVVMGYTTKEAYEEYLKKINNSNEKEQQTKDRQQTLSNTRPDGTKTMYKDEIPGDVNQEVENYIKNCIEDGVKIGEPYNEKHSSYNNLSDTAKQIVDRKIQVIEKTVAHCAETLDEYVVPKDKVLVVPNSISNALEGQTLKYNPETGKYHIFEGGIYTNVSYEIEDVKNATLK